ncbi:DUF3105 domain-containing protein [Paenibacillus agricola]|uniref:DUF3105 domain-containing protein n=1 Tax=Paenibacillus agricola TaxID=2716264 RepID=A0ABX0J663_9BACL|nr:DUF3105 domain-containing protein [Paenibacillus agricola]NHN31433.1 DUF3105 domain-containing protein [Paenibacillus agricola]
MDMNMQDAGSTSMDMQHGSSMSMSASTILLVIGIVILICSIIGYVYASTLNKTETRGLKKEQKNALKMKSKWAARASHFLLSAGIVVILSFFIQANISKTNIENLNHQAAIQVTDDKDYGGGHSDAPVQYEMKIPTSGTHSPHDLKFGFYKEKPAIEKLVHNLEHGDIIIYYHPNAKPEIIDKITELTHYKKAGSGILAVPYGDVVSSNEIVLTAWTKTLELPTFDEQKMGTFIYQFINKGPEDIPAEIRRGGGTM